MIRPTQWYRGTLGDVISSIRGGFSVKCDDRQAFPFEKAVLKTGAVLNGKFDPSKNKYVPPSEYVHLRTPVSASTIVFCRKNSEEAIGASALVEVDEPNIYLSDLLWELRPAPRTNLYWLVSILKSDSVRQRIQKEATGTQHTMKNISQDRLLSVPITVPPLPEQRRIAEVLRAWDGAIEKLRALRTAKGMLLDGLRASLLFGRRRLNTARQSSWTARRLSEITHELTARNDDMRLGRDAVMGVTNLQGIVPMREHTIPEDIGPYKRLPPHAFAYNPMRINVGSIAMNDGPEEVLVSPDYVVFRCNPDRLDPDYLDHLKKTHWWRHYVNSGGSGSVRKRTYYEDLAAMRFPVPEMDEQREIVVVLNAARDEVTKIAKQIDLLTLQKRGLMQKLLTGDWRLAIDAPVAAGGVTP